ncbi:MAG: hypothetical protein H6704_24700 [Myxococcales bacterium]|nr:hypothetical protein [Myxococcales bacterium]MCB9539426.1 hypothetical protein [Myxococcales bacterium]
MIPPSPRSGVPAALLIAALAATSAHAAEPWALAGELAVSPYSGAEGEPQRPFRAVALGGHGVYRWGDWGAGVGVEGNLFQQLDLEGDIDFLVQLLIGAEGELLMADRRLRSRLGAGVAVLLEGTELDVDGPAAGFYVDIRPVGFRWPFDGWVLGVDPLTLLVAIPEPSAIPLVDIQYRAHVYAEVDL